MNALSEFRVERTGTPLTESDLAAFEAKWRVQLPSEYREFMKKFNGGLATRRDWPRGIQGVVPVTWMGHARAQNKITAAFAGKFYKLSGSEDDFETVDYALSLHANNLPAGAVPIGRDPGSFLFLLMTEGTNRGCILLWDRTLIDGITPDDLGFVAHSLQDYLERLEPEPEDWDAWEAAHAHLEDPRQAPSA